MHQHSCWDMDRFVFCSYSHWYHVSVEPSKRTVPQIDYNGNRKPLCCSCRWWKFWLTGVWLLLLSWVLKGSVGDWRWSLDNIKWPLRAAETISLHGATFLLLSCLDTFSPPSSSLPLCYLLVCFSLCLLSGVSASWQPVSDPEVIYWER